MANEINEIMARQIANMQDRIHKSEDANEIFPIGKSEFFESESNLLQDTPPQVPTRHVDSAVNDKIDDEKKMDGQGKKDDKPSPFLLKSVALCVVISFGGFIVGWDIGIIGGITNMESFQEKM